MPKPSGGGATPKSKSSAEVLGTSREEVIQQIVAAEHEVEASLRNKVSDLPRVFNNHGNRVYTILVDEADLLDLEAGIMFQIGKYSNDIGRLDLSEENHGTHNVPGDEDGMFLGNRLSRLSAMLFQARFLRNNPTHKEAI
jgi:hypothetical protein